MKPLVNESRPKPRKLWIPLILIVLVAASGLGAAYWKKQAAAQVQTATPAVTTRPVRTGSIILAASGSVTLVAGEESALAFSASGTVAQLNVSVGDQVKKDQVLARLDSLDELQAEIKNAGQDLLSAQQQLAAFKARAAANLANAQLKVIDAQEALDAAQGSVVQKDWQRCDQATKDRFYKNYVNAVHALEALGDGGGNLDYYVNTILPQKQKVDQAKGALDSCAGYTQYQVASSHASLSVAQAELKLAQDILDVLTKNNGLDPVELSAAENKVASAQQALDTARDNLEGATLKAPFDGTILSVAGKAGDAIKVDAKNKTSAFITVADLAHPLLQFSIDETDMTMVAKGETAEVTFDAYPNRIFTGMVARVDPSLATSSGASAVSGLIRLDLSQETDVPVFSKNLSGSVQIIQASAKNVLLVPLEALRQQVDGTYAVYVMGDGGQPILKTVAVGLRDVASAEIKSGLDGNETVITSPAR